MTRTDRRKFLETSAAVAGAMAWAMPAMGTQQPKPLRLGVIGVGWYGLVDARAALKQGGTEIVAVCDVDSEH